MAPERKVIRRVVIHSDNLKKFTVYADKGSEDWQVVEEVNNVTSNPIDLSVNAPFPTDKIRIRVIRHNRRCSTSSGPAETELLGERKSPRTRQNLRN